MNRPGIQIFWLILFGVACYGFGVLSVTADELYGIALSYGNSAVYFFPVLGGRGVWDAWVLVFAGLAVCFFIAVLSIVMHQRSRSESDEKRSYRSRVELNQT